MIVRLPYGPGRRGVRGFRSGFGSLARRFRMFPANVSMRVAAPIVRMSAGRLADANSMSVGSMEAAGAVAMSESRDRVKDWQKRRNHDRR